jgi:tRNA G18 (ribose-2'-O)-methylase SpoU
VLGLRHGGTRLVAADPRGGVACERIDFRAATALLLGSEGAGIPADLLAAAAARAAIPMEPGVESLSVGAAAAVLLFEARRQRATR